jgi:hypothetical protein
MIFWYVSALNVITALNTVATPSTTMQNFSSRFSAIKELSFPRNNFCFISLAFRRRHPQTPEARRRPPS